MAKYNRYRDHTYTIVPTTITCKACNRPYVAKIEGPTLKLTSIKCVPCGVVIPIGQIAHEARIIVRREYQKSLPSNNVTNPPDPPDKG